MSTTGEIVSGDVIDPDEPVGAPFPTQIKQRRGMRRSENVTTAMIEAFLDNLAQTGLINESSAKAGLSHYTIRRLRKAEEEFEEMIAEAMDDYRELLVREADRRARIGVDEPVYSQKLGVRIGVIRKYSDRLMELMLKRHIPEFRDKFEGEIKVTGGVLISPAVAQSSEEWRARYSGPVLSNYGDEPAALPPASPAPQAP